MPKTKVRILLCLLVLGSCPHALSADDPGSMSALRFDGTAYWAARTPADLMIYLPDSLQSWHARVTMRDTVYVKNLRFERRPEFYVGGIFDVVNQADTLRIVIFSDYHYSQVVPFRVREGELEILPCSCDVFGSGPIFGMERSDLDLNNDGRLDFVIASDGSQHNTIYTLYFWLGDSVVVSSTHESIPGSLNFEDIDGDGIPELIEAHETYKNSTHLPWEYEVYKLVGRRYEKSPELQKLLPAEYKPPHFN